MGSARAAHALTFSGLATIGYALPAAIAARSACRKHGRAAAAGVAFSRDAGLGMALAEVETAVRLSLRVG